MLRVFKNQLVQEGRLVLGCVGMQMPEETIGTAKTIEQACAEARDPMIEVHAAEKNEEVFKGGSAFAGRHGPGGPEGGVSMLCLEERVGEGHET